MRTSILILALISILIGGAVMVLAIERAEEFTVSRLFVVPAAPIPAYTAIEPDMLIEKEFSRSLADEPIYLRPEELEGKITSTYPYLVQAIQFGDDLMMVALAGEVVVDYALRFKRELAGPTVWVAGYSNDVFGYVPSLRVLKEGGYEAGGAMRYTPLPGPFAPSVEGRVVRSVHRLAEKVRSPQGK